MPFKKLYQLEPSNLIKELMQQTFIRSVKTQQYSVINDIINYSRKKQFNVYVTSEAMELMIIKRQFKLS